MPRYRIEYAKTGSARFLSHLELVRVFNRALRRSGLPLVFTQGFRPHPKVSYGPSLGVGVAGLREYLDVELADPGSGTDPGTRGAASPGTGPQLSECLLLGRQFPSGLELRSLMELALGAPGIGKAVNSAWYRLALPQDQDAGAWQQALDCLAESAKPIYFQRPKDGKLFDVRSGLEACRLVTTAEELAIDLLVGYGSEAAPVRGLLEKLQSLAGAGSCYLPARLTRMALLQLNGGLINPLGERKQLWEA